MSKSLWSDDLGTCLLLDVEPADVDKPQFPNNKDDQGEQESSLAEICKNVPGRRKKRRQNPRIWKKVLYTGLYYEWKEGSLKWLN